MASLIEKCRALHDSKQKGSHYRKRIEFVSLTFGEKQCDEMGNRSEHLAFKTGH